MDPKIELAILGAGRIAQVHLQGYDLIRDKVNVCAIVDVRKEVAKYTAAEWGVGKTFQTVEEFLDQESCDAIDICLPHNLHLECVQKACAAGKHVLVEKPIARSLAEADQIVKAAERGGVTLMVAHNHVFNPLVEKAKQIIDEGLIGKPHLVKALSLGWFLFTKDDFRQSKQQTGGGVFIDTGAHFVYILRYLFGDVESVVTIQSNSVRRVSAVDSKPARGGRIKTSHFFPLNRSEMFWQGGDLRFFGQSSGNESDFNGFEGGCDRKFCV